MQREICENEEKALIVSMESYWLLISLSAIPLGIVIHFTSQHPRPKTKHKSDWLYIIPPCGHGFSTERPKMNLRIEDRRPFEARARGRMARAATPLNYLQVGPSLLFFQVLLGLCVLSSLDCLVDKGLG
ncbi:hypothetical protein C8J56DRAFT_967210 [Mycena floridula]|nr:hypothetical protein C8J56DRAFT_967210 [Mycena floridula]